MHRSKPRPTGHNQPLHAKTPTHTHGPRAPRRTRRPTPRTPAPLNPPARRSHPPKRNSHRSDNAHGHAPRDAPKPRFTLTKISAAHDRTPHGDQTSCFPLPEPSGIAPEHHPKGPTRPARAPTDAPKWRRSDSNRRPPACKAGALPAELRPRRQQPRGQQPRGQQPRGQRPQTRGPSEGAKVWAREDLNLRPHAYQACALTS